MKRCSKCNRTFSDDTLSYCLYDGTPLAAPEQAPLPPAIAPVLFPSPVPVAPSPSPSQPVAPSARPQWRLSVRGYVYVVMIGLGLCSWIGGHKASKPETGGRQPGPTQPGLPPKSQPSWQPGGETPGTPGNPQAPEGSGDALHEVEETLTQADAVEAVALRTQDFSPLQAYYTGNAYAQAVYGLSKLQRPYFEIDATLLSQQFDPQTFQLSSNPSKARLHVTEEWSLSVRNTRTGQSRSAPLHSSGTVFLEHSLDRWRIFQIQSDPTR